MIFLLKLFLLYLIALGIVRAEDSPEKALVRCDTTKGPLLIEVYPQWSPLGAQRFLELVRVGFYTDIALFRCVRNFLVQFGISDKPEYKHWNHKNIRDDPNLHLGIHKHYLSYAGGGPNTRSTQLFIAFEELDFLGHEPWETPFGKVIEGGETLDVLYKGYGDIPPFGKGPDQQEIYREGNSYIRRLFPRLDFIKECHMVENEPVVVVEEETAEENKEVDPIAEAIIERETPEEETEVDAEKDVQQATSNLRNHPSLYENVLRDVKAPHEFLFSHHIVSDIQATALITRAVFVMLLFFAALIYYFRYYNVAIGTSKSR